MVRLRLSLSEESPGFVDMAGHGLYIENHCPTVSLYKGAGEPTNFLTSPDVQRWHHLCVCLSFSSVHLCLFQPLPVPLPCIFLFVSPLSLLPVNSHPSQVARPSSLGFLLPQSEQKFVCTPENWPCGPLNTISHCSFLRLCPLAPFNDF